MKEYIERVALKERFQKRLIWLKKDIHDEYSKGLSHGCETDMGLIDEIPAADVVEVRHGYWIDHPSGGSFCSACKRWVPYSHHPKYCETCGALMKGELTTKEHNETVPGCSQLEKDKFLVFLKDFQRELGKRFSNVEAWEKWVDVRKTVAWKDALIVSSKKYMPEVFALRDKLGLWASDLLDSWLIACARDARLIHESAEGFLEVPDS